MAEFFEALDQSHTDFIAKQAMFFTASAASEGRVNLSPKGMDSFRCLSDQQVAYIDVVGSGNETAAHILADGRLTIMFCSFDRQPLIMRLYGRGEVVQPSDAQWARLAEKFPSYKGARQIVLLNIDTVQTSCGYGVPKMELLGERPTLKKWAEGKSEDELVQYQLDKNATSIDGLDTGLKISKREEG